MDNDFATGSLGNTSSGLDSVILRVKGEEHALDSLELDGPVVPAFDNMNVTVGHALPVPATSAMQTPRSAPPRGRDPSEAPGRSARPRGPNS